jgi:hypothetical protein
MGCSKVEPSVDHKLRVFTWSRMSSQPEPSQQVTVEALKQPLSMATQL